MRPSGLHPYAILLVSFGDKIPLSIVTHLSGVALGVGRGVVLVIVGGGAAWVGVVRGRLRSTVGDGRGVAGSISTSGVAVGTTLGRGVGVALGEGVGVGV